MKILNNKKGNSGCEYALGSLVTPLYQQGLISRYIQPIECKKRTNNLGSVYSVYRQGPVFDFWVLKINFSCIFLIISVWIAPLDCVIVTLVRNSEYSTELI